MLRWQPYLLEHKMENPYVEPEFKDENGLYYPTKELMDKMQRTPNEMPDDELEQPSYRKTYNRAKGK